MAMQGIGGLGAITNAGAPQKTVAEKFGSALKGQTGGPRKAAPRGEMEPLKVLAQRAEPSSRAQPGKVQAGSTQRTQQVKALEPAKMVEHIAAAQKRMDSVLELAQSGRSFTPAELLSLQTQMYRASQELDLAGKVVEKATGGVKQILQTQV